MTNYGTRRKTKQGRKWNKNKMKEMQRQQEEEHSLRTRTTMTVTGTRMKRYWNKDNNSIEKTQK